MVSTSFKSSWGASKRAVVEKDLIDHFTSSLLNQSSLRTSSKLPPSVELLAQLLLLSSSPPLRSSFPPCLLLLRRPPFVSFSPSFPPLLLFRVPSMVACFPRSPSSHTGNLLSRQLSQSSSSRDHYLAPSLPLSLSLPPSFSILLALPRSRSRSLSLPLPHPSLPSSRSLPT